ncbi:MAG: ATP-grasp domain-containing protein [Halieaceae bacterium]|jgi:5-(carboxyamino)imidazole ribonucleotide synthase|nr:ATP-grasp domain-containing protein [Halieaceae bacterium]
MNLRLGIIGAGQLGLYLCQTAHTLGINTCVLSDDGRAPAVAFADHAVIGPLQDTDTLNNFIEASDIVTFEKEDIPNESLQQLIEAEAAGRIVVRPGAQVLFLLKDKGTQKTWLMDQGFPTLPFQLLQGEDLPTGALVDRFGLPLVQKARCGGYDGLGVQILRNPQDLQRLWTSPSLVEPFLPDCREVAVLMARGADGQCVGYPVFGMDFDPELNLVTTVFTPSRLPAEMTAEALDLGERILNALGGVGVFAIELFVTPDNRLLVNEISPRVHNSGHLTMEASPASQFELHVRACAGLPLADVSDTRPAAMANVLYEDRLEKCCPDRPVCQRSEGEQLAVHWYGKPPGRLGRKMGHITALAETADAASEAALEALQKLPSLSATRAA